MKQKIPSPKIFTNESVETPRHDDMLLHFNPTSSNIQIIRRMLCGKDLKKPKEIIIYVNSNGEIYDNKGFGYSTRKEIKLKEFEMTKKEGCPSWEPEKVIMSNKYYIGSVDLYTTQIKEYHIKFLYNGKHYNQEYQTNFQEVIFEFKPTLKSFSEAIRQVKVYQEYFKSAKFYIVTYSNISKFKDIFKSQNIGLLELTKEGDILNYN